MDDIGYKSPIASIDQIKKQSLDNSGMGSLKQKKQTIKLEQAYNTITDPQKDTRNEANLEPT